MQNTRGASLNDAQDSQSAAEGTGGSPRPRRIGVLVAVALAALALDVITKVVVVARLEGRTPIELLGGLLTLRVTRNSGAAFSIGTGLTIVFTLIALGVVVAILRTARNLRSLPWAVSLGLLLGGATGNLADRLLRSPSPLEGHVVDWIELPYWPVFNLADSAIVCGGILAVVLAARGLQLDGTRVSDTEAADGAGTGAEGGPEDVHEDGAEDRAGDGGDKECRKES
jgi:signal peptidase II